MRFLSICLVLCLLVAVQPAQAQSSTFYVATNGSDSAGNGSLSSPWATITFALQKVPDGSLILVRPGTYTGQVKLKGSFSNVTIRSEVPYRAVLRFNDQVLVTSGPATGIVFEGFDIAHSGPGAGPLVAHIMGSRKVGLVTNITLRNNIFHDSYNSDLLKIDASASNIIVESNIFYNQSGSDEHIDVNSARAVVIRGNVFFNDFAGSGRPNNSDTSNFIVVKDSSGNNDELMGSHNITISGNVFFNWQGITASAFIMIGEDGKPYFEAQGVMIENNLMLGNSPFELRAPIGVYGSKDVTVRNNTISGDLPSWAYAMLLSKAVDNPSNQNIRFFNNIWTDQTGTMGAQSGQTNNDFSDAKPDRTTSFILDNNVYWNNGAPIPTDASEKINYTDDPHRIVNNPGLPLPREIALPRWNPTTGLFGDGSTDIKQTFVRLVNTYGAISSTSPAAGAADPSTATKTDILGRSRGDKPDVGAFQSAVSLAVNARPGNTAAEIVWQYDAPLPEGATCRIDYTSPNGPNTNVAINLPVGTRTYRIDGLANYVPYTFTVTAVSASGATLLSKTIPVMPTDIFIYLPTTRKSGR